MSPSSNSWKSQKSHHWILEGARRRSWAHNPCKLSSQYGSQSAWYAGRASACYPCTGACRCCRPVIYLSVVVERVRRHGLWLDPHCAYCRAAHRALNWPSGQSGSDKWGGDRNGVFTEKSWETLARPLITTTKTTKVYIPPCLVVWID